MSLNKSDLLARCERRFRDVALPDGGSVRIRSLTEFERSSLELRMFDKSGKVSVAKLPEAKLRTLACCIVDDAGEPLFAEQDWREIQALDSGIVAKIYSACLEHIGFEDEEIEELAGN